MTSTPLTPLLIDEATKKSGLVWVTTSAGVSPVWLLWHEGSAYVLSGPGEQPCHGLEPGGGATVTVRSKDKGSRLVSWVADVSRLNPDTTEWTAIVPPLMGKRLNLVDGEAAAARWARECLIHRLTPTGEVTDSPGHMPEGSLAAPPPSTPATTDVPMPFTVGGSTRKLPRRSRR
ncbi:hypothetical protein acdb102_03810 [Acidothermaceae bacterium B102]|nr:hypothetical protein acdb102_03810 [Acidothermaceae bacterium B102]